MLKEESEEGIIMQIQQDQEKWWNHTFLIKKPNGTWRKILDASKLNKEIEKLHIKIHGPEEVQYLTNQMDYAKSIDFKSAFHHITVSPNSRLYLIFKNNENIGAIRMDNISRQMRKGTEIDNNIPGMDMKPEGNEYKNERQREDKITNSVDRHIKLRQTRDKKSVFVSIRIRQIEDINAKNNIMGLDNDSKQVNDQGTEFVEKENRVISNQNLYGTENEGQRSKTSTRQCGRLPSGPVADLGRDLLMKCMMKKEYSKEVVNLLFKGQRFNTVKNDFYSLALLQDWLDIERITIDEMIKNDAEVILTEVTEFHIKQNNSVAKAKSHKACLTAMLSLICKENLAVSTISKLINKALAKWINPLKEISKNQEHSICFFRPNEIAEIRLKFFNVNKTENQASLILASKQVKVIETYEKQFPKGIDFLLWHKGFNKPNYYIRHQFTTNKAFKRTEDNRSISIFNMTLCNNRVGKARYP
ncbi:MAG: hypothetical protein EZS28_015066 [Streblomastix strix]|uniref:Reverse transcriptase domain-containing protein n=1 Tax=Streblomastix strix TaxID=222440 RepID=A0A5J4W495_9EUKA|nr:MAG: hypothetical protein EZS28_015066 [Streblomastix strix]